MTFFALIKVTQKHNEVCMDTSYYCYLTTTCIFSMDPSHTEHTDTIFVVYNEGLTMTQPKASLQFS